MSGVGLFCIVQGVFEDVDEETGRDEGCIWLVKEKLYDIRLNGWQF